ncbi:MAG: DUF3761 domain-containing protein [Candidatus Saccharibacteria bacterium]
MGKLSFMRHKRGVGALVIVGILLIIGANSNPAPKTLDVQNASNTANSQQHSSGSNAKPKAQADQITTKDVTAIQDVAFTSSTQDDSSLAAGQTKVLQTGHTGQTTIVYAVTYKNGAETGRVVKSQSVTTQPINEVIAHGTYIAPAPVAAAPAPASCGSGYYLNSDGNCIHSPSSDPTGATAQCVDGSYSYSQHRSGTCSHHGGVASWL